MNLGTGVVLSLIVGWVAWVVRGILRDKKQGKLSCGGDCCHCSGACHGK